MKIQVKQFKMNSSHPCKTANLNMKKRYLYLALDRSSGSCRLFA
jgi:hypothetical protein